ncbi:MAG: hypothetical protein IKD76_03060 [Clostridia bacterium]|nr:hypothetical protein [Clostridia bacterium]
MLMDFTELSKLYSALKVAGTIEDLNLRELQSICEQEVDCSCCTCRATCPIRLSFYLKTRYFEFLLQKAEAQDRAFLDMIFYESDYDSKSIENLVFEKTENFRYKRKLELAEHPRYSAV